MKRFTVTAAIAAYNAEKNIGHMLTSLIGQRQNSLDIESIVVCSEGSTDRTVEIVKSFSDPRIRLLGGAERHGFAGAVRTILSDTQSEITVVLNDDIKINDDHFIEKLAVPFRENSNIGLVTGNPQPLKPESFVERAVVSGYRAWDETRSKLQNIHSALTADGKILALSYKFAKSISYPKNLADMACVDSYLYMACVTQGFGYRWVPEAKVYFRAVTSWHEYLSLHTRNNANRYLLIKHFGDRVDKEYSKPFGLYLKESLKQFILNPLGVAVIFVLGFYTRFKAKGVAQNFNPLWEVVESSKNLN